MSGQKLTPLKPILILAGPTASGKTRLALDIAERIQGIIINADSIQIYKELQILSSRPTIEQQMRASHQLYGILSVHERCSAGRWLSLVKPAIEKSWESQKIPLITGGTGLYIKVLLDGISAIPDIPSNLINDLQKRLSLIGAKAFREELAKKDPNAASRILPNDSQRLVRAASVIASTGQSLEYWWSKKVQIPAINARFLTIVLYPPRELLYSNIEARFDEMILQGAVDEAAEFSRLSVDPALPAARAVGLKELLRYINHELDLSCSIKKAKQATRNLAKRQLTWAKNNINANFFVCEQYSEDLIDRLIDKINKFLLTDPQ